MISQLPPHPSPAPETKLKTLVASDDRALGEQVREVLRGQADCLAHSVVSIELLPDRAAHVSPGLVVVVLPAQIESAYQAMREVAQAVPTHILAAGPAEDPKLILRTLHEGGANEYLDVTRLQAELTDALTRFRGRRDSPSGTRTTGRVISVLAPSGGSGSSTLAVNLAAALASEGESCGLVDLRLTAGDLSALLDIQPRYGVADLCENFGRLDRSMFDQFFERHASGVHLLAAPGQLAQVDAVHPKGIRQAVAMARAEFPYVVIDLDNVYSDEQLEAIWQSDVVVLVLRLDYTSLRNVRRTIEHLQKTGVDPSRIKLVVNRLGERNQLSVAEAEQALGQKLLDQIPDEPSCINAAINAGVPVVLHRPRARVSRRLSGLAGRLNGNGTTLKRPRSMAAKWFNLSDWGRQIVRSS